MAESHRSWSYRNAHVVGRAVFYLVLLGGLVLVGVQTAPHVDELTKNPFVAQIEKKEVVTRDASGNVVSIEETTEPDSGSLLERALAPAGLVFVRITLVGLGAFVAGGLAKKVLEGDYDIKAGPLEITRQVECVTQTALNAFANTNRVVGELQVTMASRSDTTRAAINRLAEQIDRLREDVVTLQRQVQPLTSRRPPT